MEPPAHSAPSVPSSSTDRSNAGDAASQLVQSLPHHPFTSSQASHRTLESRHQALTLARDKPREEYLVFTSVPPDIHTKLTDDTSRTSKYCQFSYSETTGAGTLIAKVKASPEADIAARRFDTLIALELDSMGVHDIEPLGSTTVTIGNWKKEADCSWGPVQYSTELSFVAIVGLSESARHLALDARAWLEPPTSSVKLVVTIAINRGNPEVIMQRWEILTRSCPAAHCSSTIRVYRDNNTSTTGVQLVLPFEKVVGRPATGPAERDIILSEPVLQQYAERLWVRQGFM
ncbi:hypothetical protein ALT_8536 [Aspergillus lentulus]|uniref:Uncharacterized protein n=1 Tax=Aspergillus lentulus TaxID=293939 RepID=A0AAN4PQH7_ASPLE|nr:hypothetical protein ALT_8536 [Aspergillus lentulus]